MKPNIGAIIAAISLQELDKIKAMEEAPSLEALLTRLEARRGEHDLLVLACEAFMAGGAR